MKLDARGLSCPEPVMIIKKAMETTADSYEITVDNHASKENITRFAENKGYEVSIETYGNEYTLIITKKLT